MARDVPTIEPRALTAGDFCTWRLTSSDFPASTSDVAYRIVGKHDFLKFDPAWVTKEGDDFLIEIPAAETAKLKGGEYRIWRTLNETAGSDKVSEELPFITVAADPAQLTSLRTPDEKLLETIDAALAAFAADGTVKMYMIDGKQVMREELTDLRAWRADVVRRIQARRSPGFGTRVLFEFPSTR